MECVYQFILKIKDCPGVYIGDFRSSRASIHVLKAMLDGYSMRDIEINGIPAGGAFLDKFQRYIEEYYKEKRAFSWATIIQNHSDSPEQDIELFFFHIDGFTKNFLYA